MAAKQQRATSWRGAVGPVSAAGVTPSGGSALRGVWGGRASALVTSGRETMAEKVGGEEPGDVADPVPSSSWGSHALGGRLKAAGAAGGIPGGTNTETVEKHANTQASHRDRILFAFCCAIGELVECRTRSGDVYRGILSDTNLSKSEPNIGIVLSMAQRISASGDTASGAAPSTASRHRNGSGSDQDNLPQEVFIEELVVNAGDIVQVFVKNVSLEGDFSGTSLSGSSGAFATDREISRRQSGVKGRQLQRFDDFQDSEPSIDLSLTSRAKWDQFAVNEERFGVRSTFDEEQYTTKIDRSLPGYSDREREAERVAAEIEKEKGGSLHMMEERGQTSNLRIDEEAMYGSVTRESTNTGRPAESELVLPQSAPESFANVPMSKEDAAKNLSKPTSALKKANSSLQLPGSVPLAHIPPNNNVSEQSSSRGSLGPALRAVKQDGGKPQENLKRHVPKEILEEKNRVRMSLSGAASPSSSGRSPSPPVSDSTAMVSLNLENSSPRLSKEVQETFMQYKAMKIAEQSAEDEKRLRCSVPLSRVSSSGSLKEAKAGKASDKDIDLRPIEADAGSVSQRSDTTRPLNQQTAEPTAKEDEKDQEKPKSKLNPAAKEFKLNPNAPEFYSGRDLPGVHGPVVPDVMGMGPMPFVSPDSGAPMMPMYGHMVPTFHYGMMPQYMVPNPHYPPMMGSGTYPMHMMGPAQMPPMYGHPRQPLPPMYSPQSTYYPSPPPARPVSGRGRSRMSQGDPTRPGNKLEQ